MTKELLNWLSKPQVCGTMFRFCTGTVISFCSNTGSIRDDHHWFSRKKSLKLIELSSINKVSLV